MTQLEKTNTVQPSKRTKLIKASNILHEWMKSVCFWVVALLFIYITLFGGSVHIEFGEADAVLSELFREISETIALYK